jgi:EAL and modified HD-GYP domain-containing signal transduction protein
LANGSMACYYRAGAAQELNAGTGPGRLEAAAADKVARADAAAARISIRPCNGSKATGSAPPAKAVGAQAASRALALQGAAGVADADTHEIEALLRQDPTLSYHLLKLVNSLGMGTGRRVTSFSQAILIPRSLATAGAG